VDGVIKGVVITGYNDSLGKSSVSKAVSGFTGVGVDGVEDVELVAGVTYSSNAVRGAVKDALAVLGFGGDEGYTDEQIRDMAAALIGSDNLTEIANPGTYSSVKKIYKEGAGKGFVVYTQMPGQYVPVASEGLVAIDPEGKIIGVDLITWVVGHGVEPGDFETRFAGKTAADVGSVELVTGATYTAMDFRQSVADALGYPDKYEVLLGQFVNLLRNGTPVRMSKRRGTMITFQELVDEAGVDATRYTLISRSSNQTIDFDIEKVKEQNNSNPVYYVQYAHARICSILRRAAGVSEQEATEIGMDEVARRALGEDYDLSLLTDPTELALSRKLSEFPDLVASCARDRAPFRITHFCEELAAAYHGFYHDCQVLPSEGRPLDGELSRARLAACDAVRVNLEVALRLIGVSAPTVM
jgi:hypothetical protein